jgi:hypothetical protein
VVNHVSILYYLYVRNNVQCFIYNLMKKGEEGLHMSCLKCSYRDTKMAYGIFFFLTMNKKMSETNLNATYFAAFYCIFKGTVSRDGG